MGGCAIEEEIIQAMGNYLNDEKKARYEQVMQQAAQDNDYMARTLETQDAFTSVDTEEWGER